MAEFDAALLGAASGIGTATVNYVGTKKQQKRAYEYGEMAANAAYERQKEYFNDTFNAYNEYNSPSAQLQRVKDAGLSVGAFYSGTGQSAGASGETSAPQGHGSSSVFGPNYSPADFDVVGRQLAIERQRAEIRNINSQTAKTDRDTAFVDVQEDLLDSQIFVNTALGENATARTVGELLNNNFLEQTFGDRVEITGLQLQQNRELLSQYVEETKRSVLNTRFQSDTYDDRVAGVEADLQLKYGAYAVQLVQVRAAEAGIQLTEAQVQSLWAEIPWIGALRSNTLKDSAQSRRESRQRTKTSGQAERLLGKRADYVSKEVDWFNFEHANKVVESWADKALGVYTKGIYKGSGSGSSYYDNDNGYYR